MARKRAVVTPKTIDHMRKRVADALSAARIVEAKLRKLHKSLAIVSTRSR